ncbi:unnamed protein product [Pleuronectes platessa]|uniref:Uncharacterized protein n=1 Tax=Pleuronectes platessa TaxID=8262 RepID=A0A9N7YZW4_PLEPL|nr:unnamed protein product [Pleuronectes platessa]
MKYQERASESRDTVKAERVLVEQPLSDRLLLNYGNSENHSFYGLSCSEISAAASSSEQKLQLTQRPRIAPQPEEEGAQPGHRATKPGADTQRVTHVQWVQNQSRQIEFCVNRDREIDQNRVIQTEGSRANLIGGTLHSFRVLARAAPGTRSRGVSQRFSVRCDRHKGLTWEWMGARGLALRLRHASASLPRPV